MRQAGILAAAGIHALEHHVDRLAEDHHHARLLAEGLMQAGLQIAGEPETNMVHLDLPADAMSRLKEGLAGRDIRISNPRLVLHRDISREDVEHVLSVCRELGRQL